MWLWLSGLSFDKSASYNYSGIKIVFTESRYLKSTAPWLLTPLIPNHILYVCLHEQLCCYRMEEGLFSGCLLMFLY